MSEKFIRILDEFLKNLKYGEIVIKVRNGQITEINNTEKIRFDLK
jgi:hypothetical protein